MCEKVFEELKAFLFFPYNLSQSMENNTILSIFIGM
jgi:hypothetical protein